MSAAYPSDVLEQASALIAEASVKGLTVATAESCTGGLIAGAITSIDGSSAVFGYGFVTYANEAKERLLGVPAAMLAGHGAVSRETACAMAQGALAASGADIAVSVTGIAGPGGGTPLKPVGLVHFGCAVRGGETVHAVRRFGAGGRDAVRMDSVRLALELLRAGVARAGG